MPAFQVTGMRDWERFTRALEEAGKGTPLRRELQKAVTKSARPLKDAVKRSAAATLPKSGGLNERVAASRFTVRTKIGRDPAITLTAKGRRLRDIVATDKGRVSHPVFARSGQSRKEWTWVQQSVTPGWWSNPIRSAGPAVRKDVLDALETVVDNIARKGAG